MNLTKILGKGAISMVVFSAFNNTYSAVKY